MATALLTRTKEEEECTQQAVHMEFRERRWCAWLAAAPNQLAPLHAPPRVGACSFYRPLPPAPADVDVDVARPCKSPPLPLCAMPRLSNMNSWC